MKRLFLSGLKKIAASLLVLPVLLTPVGAQQSSGVVQTAEEQGPSLQEVVVTARKRAELISNVPVVEQAIQQEQMHRLQVIDFTDLPTLFPGLDLGHTLLSIGTLVSIRGVGTSSLDPGIDQSVGLYIDGLSLSNGLAFNSGLFDVGQIEVLKGPQDLFYGKSTTGGVIDIHTADPTDKREVIAQAGYDFEAETRRMELILSGPVTDTLKLRLASEYSASAGYFDNVAVAIPGTGAVTPTYSRAPDSEDYVIRGTALWDPISEITTRLKVNFVHDRTIDADTDECADAPGGTSAIPGFPAFFGGEPCGLSRTLRLVYLDPTAFPDALNNGVPFLQTNQAYGTFEMNATPTKDLTYTSVTSYYNLSSASLVNPDSTAAAGPFLGVNNHFHRREFTEELRVNSDFNGPVNFGGGAFYEDGDVNDHVTVLGNGAYGLPSILEDGVTPFTINTKSLYGQLRWDIVKRLEFAPGLRWSDETRVESPFDYVYPAGTGSPAIVPTITPAPTVHSKRYMPEITLTYRPTDDLTLFGAMKRGYKSGSFSIATPPVAGVSNSFHDEKVQGGEIGLKSRLLDHRLQLNVAAYDYGFNGLQVGVVSPPVGGLPLIETLNAAEARTYGIDADAAYLPALISGLEITAAVEWDHARYTSFNNVPCWGGQTIAEGCNQNFNPATGLYTGQNLSGTALIRAPDWQGNLGFDYEMPLNDYTLVFTNSNAFSGRFPTFLAVGRPNNDNYQDAFAKVDLGMTLQGPRDLWEVALISKDVNDKITAGVCTNNNGITGDIVANPVGGTTPSPYGVNPAFCFADPGREVWLRFTVKYVNL